MTKYLPVLAVFAMMVLGTPQGFGATSISGAIDGTLTAVNSPYLVQGDLDIPAGKTLYVESGVDIRFNGPYKVDVYGRIVVQGKANDSVRFIPNTPGLVWKGIVLHPNEPSDPGSVFNHVYFSGVHSNSYAKKSFGVILVDTAHNIVFRHCTFFRNTGLIGTCIRSNQGSYTINHCDFIENQATDSNNSPGGQYFEPGAAAIFTNFSAVTIDSSRFLRNVSWAPNYPRDDSLDFMGSRTISFFGARVRISDCLFQGNEAERGNIIFYHPSIYDGLYQDTFWFVRNKVIRNRIKEEYILNISGEYSNHVRAYVENCLFEENWSPTGSFTTTLDLYNLNGGKNVMLVEQCSFLNNSQSAGIGISGDTYAYVNRSEITGQRGVAVFSTRSFKSRFVNCIIHNNWGGITSSFEGSLDVINSVIAYNGLVDTSIRKIHLVTNGLYVEDRGRLDVYNSIILGNRGHLGQMANYTAINRFMYPGNLFNCVLEGGIDSTYRQPIDLWEAQDTVPFKEIRGLITDLPQFMNPPGGFGVDYAGLEYDFHLVQDCDSTIGFNSGETYLPNYPFGTDLWQGDFDRNERIVAGLIDIGPFELKGEKGQTILYEPWRDTVLCSNNLGAFNPEINGFDPKFRWQWSSNGSIWADLDTTKFVRSTLVEPDSGHYRVITYQAECNVLDTFGPHRLSIIQAPPLGFGNDTTIKPDDTVWLSPGNGYVKYIWNIPGGDTSTLPFKASKYSVGRDSFAVWCQYYNANGCYERDSIVFRFARPGSTKDEVNNRFISVYPVPAGSRLKIRVNDGFAGNPYSCEMYTTLGQRVKAIHFLQGESEIDISDIPNGCYTIVVYSGDSAFRTVIIKSSDH